jgi:hypothetical protein
MVSLVPLPSWFLLVSLSLGLSSCGRSERTRSNPGNTLRSSAGGETSLSNGGVPSGGIVAQGSGSGGEFVDSTGRCVRSIQLASEYCPASYNEALKLHDSCGMACAGSANGLLIYMDYCTPSHGCAYAADSRLLVGYQLASDSPSFCSNKAGISYGGQFPPAPTFDSLDLNENCPKQ